jgi:hypothetical protein
MGQPGWHDRYVVASRATEAIIKEVTETIKPFREGLAVFEPAIRELEDPNTRTRLEDIVLEALREHEDAVRG